MKGFAKTCMSSADGRCASSAAEANVGAAATTVTVRAFDLRVLGPTTCSRRTDGAFSTTVVAAVFAYLALRAFLRGLGATTSALRPKSTLSLLLRMFSALSTASVQSDSGQLTAETWLIVSFLLFLFFFFFFGRPCFGFSKLKMGVQKRRNEKG